ncbi:relaxase/mobilization nuclease domain-containing protein [Leptolyngbya sp. AN02str]|uniref:relaxase/mobilization nuclease domain-containing protein n=1 Tax=Leptolyngbya sp. AN02str TaxID=3423363 RepID=UPI003D31CE26
MIGKLITGTDAHSTLSYVIEKDGADQIATNLSAETLTEFASEFERVHQLHPTVARSVVHCALSLEPGEFLDDEQWEDATGFYLEQMGYTDTPFVLVRHTDTGDRDHVHLVTSRIRWDGSVVSDSWEKLRSRHVIQEVETTYGLTSTAAAWSQQRKPPSRKELDKEKEYGFSVKQRLQALIDETLPHVITLEQLRDRLQARGVESQIRCNKQGRPQGISFSLDGVALAGNQLGRAYTLPNLLSGMPEQHTQPNSTEDTLHLAVKRSLQTVLKLSLGQHPKDWEQFRLSLSQFGVLPHLQFASRRRDRHQRLKGVSYAIGELSFNGKDLGDAYALPALQDLAATYEPASSLVVPLQQVPTRTTNAMASSTDAEASIEPPSQNILAVQRDYLARQELYEQLSAQFDGDDVAIARYLVAHGAVEDITALFNSPHVQELHAQGKRTEEYLIDILAQAQREMSQPEYE